LIWKRSGIISTETKHRGTGTRDTNDTTRNNSRNYNWGTMNTQEIEHIPVTPTSEIVLRMEEIPPLDVFYNP